MPELVAERGLDVDEARAASTTTWEIDANWKVFQDNTIECYHCPTTHPELARALDMKPRPARRSRVGGRYWIHHTIPFREGFARQPHDAEVAGVPFNYYYHWVFPTTYLQFAGRGFDIGIVDMIAVDKIRFRHLCFMPPDTPEELLAHGGQASSSRTPRSGRTSAICNRVQTGSRTGLAPTGRLLAEPEHLLLSTSST